MASTAKNKQSKRRRGYSGHKAKKQSNSRYLNIGVALLVIALIGFGMAQVLGVGGHQTANASAIQVDANDLQSTRMDGSHSQQGAGEAPVAAADREIQYLGPASDPATVSLAESGQVGQPTLLWFHADWCHVCQQIKPEMIDLGQEYNGNVKIVRLNVDHAESRDAVRRYGVRATPTFVLFDTQGQVRGNVPGWPGYQAVTNAFDQLLTGS